MARVPPHRLIHGQHLEHGVLSPESYEAFERRRRLLRAGVSASALGLGLPALGAFPGEAWAQGSLAPTGKQPALPLPLLPLKSRPMASPPAEQPTPEADVTSYNNYYEFGLDKADPARYAPSRLRTRPWSLKVEGLVGKPLELSAEDLLSLAPLEDRIYRMRCVEGWSMVIPWVGFPLHALLRKAQTLGSAKFVEFVTLSDRTQMPGLRSPVLQWPYREGLRLDEAMHDLTILAVGLYGKTLPAQNGAPIRLVVPWKYGFKGAKSLVAIRLVEKQPLSSWERAAPQEYGFYANVNPDVPHPRWSQATERRIGEGGLFAARRKTLPFNGYADLVAPLYAGLDLRRHY